MLASTVKIFSVKEIYRVAAIVNRQIDRHVIKSVEDVKLQQKAYSPDHDPGCNDPNGKKMTPDGKTMPPYVSKPGKQVEAEVYKKVLYRV